MNKLQRNNNGSGVQSITLAVFKMRNMKNSLHSTHAKSKEVRINSREEFEVEEIQRKSSANSSNSHSESHQHTIQGK